jgi:RNA polymerase sigma factor (TIGR02999 family)
MADATAEQEQALDEVFVRLYVQLRNLASRVRSHAANPSLTATALVHEAYLKLRKSSLDLTSESCDEAIFANAMRQILIDAARRNSAQKRVPASSSDKAALPMEDALTVEALVASLRREDPRQGRIVDCRFYLGMTVHETAAALGLSTATVEREWRVARAHLGEKIHPKRAASNDRGRAGAFRGRLRRLDTGWRWL